MTTSNQTSSNYKSLTPEEKLSPDLTFHVSVGGDLLYHLPLLEFTDEYSGSFYQNYFLGTPEGGYAPPVPSFLEKLHKQIGESLCLCECIHYPESTVSKIRQRDPHMPPEERFHQILSVNPKATCGKIVGFYVRYYNGRKIAMAIFSPNKEFLQQLVIPFAPGHNEVRRIVADCRFTYLTATKEDKVDHCLGTIHAIDIEIKDPAQDT